MAGMERRRKRRTKCEARLIGTKHGFVSSLPQLLAAEAAAASLSDDAFEQIDPLVNDLLVLDTKVGTAAAAMEADRTSAVKQISDAKSAALDIQLRTIRIVRSLLRPKFD
jgi:hypothetical protein